MRRREGEDVGRLRHGIERAGDAAGELRDAVEINLGGFDAVVAEKFLHLSDAGSTCEEVGGEAVAQGVGGDSFVKSGFAGGKFERFPEGVFMDVVPPDDAGAWIGGFTGAGEQPEPGPFAAGIGEFAFEVVG